MTNLSTRRIDSRLAQDILGRIRDVRVAVVGDMCLDAYWFANMRESVLSNETPHHPLPVREERYSPGGGANVAVNVSALGANCSQIGAIIGNDWRGRVLTDSLRSRGIRTDGFIVADDWLTTAYCKPMRRGISDVVYEDPRIDFENTLPPPTVATEELLKVMRGLAGTVDAVAVSDQCLYGCVTEEVREALSELATHIPVVVDSRKRAHLYRRVIVKPNEHEAQELFSVGLPDDEQSIIAALDHIHQRSLAPAIITLGDKGSCCFDGVKYTLAPEIPCEPPIDIVGAGDTFLAAVASALGAGVDLSNAIAFANAAAAVSVKQCGTTGTATAADIFDVIDMSKR